MPDITAGQITSIAKTEPNINTMQQVVNTVNRQLGWFETDRTFGDEIALLVSELGETVDAWRVNGDANDQTSELCDKPGMHLYRIDQEMPTQEFWPEGVEPHFCKPEGVGSELADILVRLLDTTYRYGIDLPDEFWRKVRYNVTRSHRHGNRAL